MTTPIADHSEQAVDSLAAQFRAQPGLTGIARALGNRTQLLEDLFVDLRDKRTLANAEGDQLDVLGELVGQPRYVTDTDTIYRRKIAAAVLRNRSKGTGNELIAIAVLITDGIAAHVWDTPPAAFVLAVEVAAPLTADEETALIEFVLASKSNAVGVLGIAWYVGDVFGFLGYPDPPFDGYGDGGAAPGGVWAKYIYP